MSASEDAVLRTSIDAALVGARREWDAVRSPDADDLVLVAKMDDASVRIVARRRVVLERAHDLERSGWDVAISDASGRPLCSDGREMAPGRIVATAPAVTLPEGAEPPPLARPDVRILSESA